jgi:hypothetical protein
MHFRSDMEIKVRQLLDRAAVGPEVPIPLEKIADFLGYKTFALPKQFKEAHPALEGILVRSDQMSAMLVDTDLPLFRQRHILAKQIGFAYLFSELIGKKPFVFTKEDNYTVQYRDAETFSEILLRCENEQMSRLANASLPSGIAPRFDP